MLNVLITAASGNIGTELVPLLIQSPLIGKIVLPTSNASTFATSTKFPDKIIVEEGSIQDPQWLEQKLRQHAIDTAFLCLTGTLEFTTTVNAISSIKRSGCVKHLVYLSAAGDFASPTFAKNLLGGCLAANCLVKVFVEQVLQEVPGRGETNGFSWTAIGPTLFMENDRRWKEAVMRQGFFPSPFCMGGVSRVSVQDIALAAVNAIEDQGKVWNRKKVMIGSKKIYDDECTLRLWEQALGKPVKIQSGDEQGLDALENAMRPMDPAWARSIRLLHEAMGKQLWYGKGLAITEEQYEDEVKLLGREPIRYEDWVEKEAAGWIKGT